MTGVLGPVADTDNGSRIWLTRYYLTRAVFSTVWVGAALTLAGAGDGIVTALLVSYPAWDSVANLIDGLRNGGLRANPMQALNSAVSAVTTAAVAIASAMGMHAVLGVFGVWAALSGLLQLATGVRRWKSAGGQWPMALSGIQSTAAGVSFLVAANATEVPQITSIAPYAAFGAFYFFLSAIWLTVGAARRSRTAKRN